MLAVSVGDSAEIKHLLTAPRHYTTLYILLAAWPRLESDPHRPIRVRHSSGSTDEIPSGTSVGGCVSEGVSPRQ